MKSFNCKTNSEKRKPTARVAEITSVVWYSPYGNKASLLLLPSVLGRLFFGFSRTFAFTCLLSLPNIDGPREYCFWTHATTECLKKKRFGAKGNEYRLLLLNAYMHEAGYTKLFSHWTIK